MLASRGLKSAVELAAKYPHGVRLRYMAGCRCRPCRMANTNYETQRAKARKAGDWNGLVDAKAAQQHIVKLGNAGVGRRMVAAASGVSDSSIMAIKNGTKPQIRARTSRKILAVNESCRGDATLISAKRLWRRINKLLYEGYTKTALAKMLGYSRALQFDRKLVTVSNDARVEALYQRLMT